LFSGKRQHEAKLDTGTDGVVFQLWGQRGWYNFDVVGESHHSAAIRALLPSGRQGDSGREVEVAVVLRHDPNNQYDRNAVEVRAPTGLVGYLPREAAARYAPTLSGLQAQGWSPTTTARVWGYEGYGDGNEFVGSVRLDLAEPHMLIPANAPPDGPHEVIPVGSQIQVTGEENYMDAISPYLNANGECWVHATLHEVVEQSARTSKRLAEVRIDGDPVGRLTPKMSGDMLPAVRYLADRGVKTCVRAVVKGNRLKAEVVLYALRASELPPDWMSSDYQALAGPAASGTRSVDSYSPTHERAAGSSDHQIPKDSAEIHELLTTAPPPTPPAGWYPDPYGVARVRYWDGAQWTEQATQ
jgi:Protein of unknown function (DUF2510)/HIRAN domain